MSGWEQNIVTGNPQADTAAVEQHRQAAAAQGLAFDAQPLPTGGYHVRAYPNGPANAPPQAYPPTYAHQAPPQQAWGAPPQQQAYAAPGGMSFQTASGPNAAVGGAGGVVVGGGTQAPALSNERVKYLRKVYGLLLGAVVVASFAGFAATTLGPTTLLSDGHGHKVAVPILTALLLQSRAMMYLAFGLLFVGTLAASAVSKVRGLNVVALFGIAALMGIELAPMVFVAQFMAAHGRTLSSAPVTGAFVGVIAVFAGATSYVFVTRKDFSYLAASLSMGFWVVFAGSILAGIFGFGEVISLALASVGAIVAGGMLLLQTSRIFRGAMDDAVGDCLALLVQLRNLFMFLLRILMSSRR